MLHVLVFAISRITNIEVIVQNVILNPGRKRKYNIPKILPTGRGHERKGGRFFNILRSSLGPSQLQENSDIHNYKVQKIFVTSA